jgi:two-component system, chemotaxis family, protein-glutamate methylesterase/glutaminase
MNTRVMVVDDTTLFRRVVSDALAGVPGVEVVGTASNGKLAMTRLAALRPDLVTLDIEMPEMNGIEVLQAMRAANMNTGVIVLSAHTVHGAEMTVRALELGAFDFLTKPESGTAQQNVARLRSQLLPMVLAFARKHEIRSILSGAVRPAAAPPAVRPPGERPGRLLRRAQPLVLIGVSTGGPGALANLLPALPGQLGAPVFIVQHMPPLFTAPLAASLATKSAIRVKQAEEGEIALVNCA